MIRPAATILASVLAFVAGTGPGPAAPAGDFYEQRGTDPPFEEIRDLLPQGANSRGGVKGSRIKVNRDLLKHLPTADHRIPERILIHTLGNSAIRRPEFDRWSRWYQEDGTTQVFRLFKDEENVRNDRELAARIEAFSDIDWGEGGWHEWSGIYTILKPHGCMIFQVKNDKSDWAVSVGLGDNGDIRLNHRRGTDKTIARGMVGKPFHLFVRDNGRDYMLYLNGRLEGEGTYPRPAGSQTNFRWGMYLGANEVRHDAMLLVTGATIDPERLDLSQFRQLERSPSGEDDPPAEEPGVPPDPEGLPIPERTWTNENGSTVKAKAVYQVGADFVHLKVDESWVRYPLSELSEADRQALLMAADFARPEDH